MIDPIAIEALPDETVLILDYGGHGESFSQIYRYRYAQRLPDEISTETILDLIEEEDQETFQLIGYDMAFVPEHMERGRMVQDRLIVVGADGNQSYPFRICLRDEKIELQPATEYLPMRLFGGKALVGTDTGAYYDFAEDWIPLAQQRRPRYLQEATLLTPVLDGRDPDCVWHRRCSTPASRLRQRSKYGVAPQMGKRISSFTPWQPEPSPCLRANGSEIPFLRSSRSTVRNQPH